MLRELDDVKPDGMDNVFLLNGGTEAVEMAMKVARKPQGERSLSPLGTHSTAGLWVPYL